MSKQDRFDNPDYVKFQNDKRKKKETILHLKQRLNNYDRSIEQARQWQARREKDLHEDILERHELWLRIQELEKGK
jgi:hypothetical protein